MAQLLLGLLAGADVHVAEDEAVAVEGAARVHEEPARRLARAGAGMLDHALLALARQHPALAQVRYSGLDDAPQLVQIHTDLAYTSAAASGSDSGFAAAADGKQPQAS